MNSRGLRRKLFLKHSCLVSWVEQANSTVDCSENTEFERDVYLFFFLSTGKVLFGRVVGRFD